MDSHHHPTDRCFPHGPQSHLQEPEKGAGKKPGSDTLSEWGTGFPSIDQAFVLESLRAPIDGLGGSSKDVLDPVSSVCKTKCGDRSGLRLFACLNTVIYPLQDLQ